MHAFLRVGGWGKTPAFAAIGPLGQMCKTDAFNGGGHATLASQRTLFVIPLLAVQTGVGAADTLSAKLKGYEEVPALFTLATGTFSATTTANSIAYTLTYTKLSGAVQQAHIHFAQRGVSGGISAFLCTNLGNGPAGTPPCPGPMSGTISGTITAANVVGFAAAQNIAAGQIGKLLNAIKGGVAYADVHTVAYPTGEIRGQIATVVP
jgi:CHRD domain